MFAMLGAALLLFAGLIPVFDEFVLFVPLGPAELWIWDFLEPFGMTVVAVWVALAVLMGRSGRFQAGALIGTGTVGVLFFTGSMIFGVALAGFGAGSAIGVIGSALVLTGGIVSIGPPEPSASHSGLGRLLALGGAALLVVGWFVPVIGAGDFAPARRLFAPEGSAVIWDWLGFFLDPAGVVLAVLLVILMFPRAGAERGRGTLVGFGIPATLFFVGYLGFGLTVGAFGPGSLIGLAGAGLVLTAGLMPAERGSSHAPAL